MNGCALESGEIRAGTAILQSMDESMMDRLWDAGTEIAPEHSCTPLVLSCLVLSCCYSVAEPRHPKEASLCRLQQVLAAMAGHSRL